MLSFVLRWLFSTLMNFTVGLSVAVIAFLCKLPGLMWSFGPGLLSALSFFRPARPARALPAPSLRCRSRVGSFSAARRLSGGASGAAQRRGARRRQRGGGVPGSALGRGRGWGVLRGEERGSQRAAGGRRAAARRLHPPPRRTRALRVMRTRTDDDDDGRQTTRQQSRQELLLFFVDDVCGPRL